ncbi:oligosaccharide biosynthesis protein Alg14 like-domain-containing protein [Xylariaceae sp. FL0016]|nr:oligosaccharide biosynthesis protein Alg14 like-domain-containing protein [Xylariaceae sp. FL0016]
MDANREQAAQHLIAGSFGALLNITITVAVLGLSYALMNYAIPRQHLRPVAVQQLLILAVVFIVGLLAASLTRGALVRPSDSHYVLLVCGSGGHTAEMVRMIERSIRPERSAHRRWAIGEGDNMSYDKIMAFERHLFERFSKESLNSGTFDIVRFARARHVHQSWSTTPFTALFSILSIFRILLTSPSCRSSPAFKYPGVVVTNGPGTGFIFLLAVRILRLSYLVPKNRMRTIFVESWARITSLSLTGKLIRCFRLADLFIVQSEKLPGIYVPNFVAMPLRPPVPM